MCNFGRIDLVITVSLLLFLVGPSRAWQENPLFELSTHKELVHLNGYGEDKLSSVLVTGTVLCEACLDGDPELRAWPVQGAIVAVKCKAGGKRRNLNRAKGTSDEYGDFIIDLPSHLHAIPKLDKACIVKVLRLPKNSPCRRVYTAKPRGIKLSSVGNSIRTYTTGGIRFQQPSKPSRMCVRSDGYKDEESSW